MNERPMKTILKPRGVRFSDEQWARLETIAEGENKRSGGKVTASDVVRYAVDMMEAERMAHEPQARNN